MKGTASALCVVLALSAATYATSMNCGPGGYFYWNINNGTTQELWRQQFDANWTAVGSAVNFDCLAQFNSYNTGQGGVYSYRNVEVLDPRASGGTGSLVLALHTDDCATRYWWWEDMMDIWKVTNPTGTPTNSLLCGGRTGVGGWDTRDLGSVLPAPANWVPGTTSNGVSLVTSRTTNRVSYAVGSYYLHNASGSTLDCTSASEGFSLINSADFPNDYWSAPPVKDQEFGPDGALYRLIGGGINTINRCWPKNAAMDCSTATVFYNNDCATFVNPGYNGIAVGPGNLGKTLKSGTPSASPIVYVTGYDTTSQSCIFAFQDVNNDNAITVGTDNIREVWQDGQNGIDINLDWANVFLMQDIEFVAGPAGHNFLLFKQSYGTGACVLELADNGLAAVKDGVIIASGMRSDSYFLAGFEVDANPMAAIPEPATMMLLGTGALGALGWLRRRRMR